METNDLDQMIEELSNRVNEMMTDQIHDAIEESLADQIQDAVTIALQDALPDALRECLSDFDFVLPDGTIAKQRQRMKLFSPDKSRLVTCYGGLHVEGSELLVETGIGCTESIAAYQSREEAIEALAKVKKAMENNLPVFEL